MYAQLGNIVFEGHNGFTSFSVDGNEANFAEFELINSKPRLQKVGDTLQQLTIGIKLHSRFVNIQELLTQLGTYKNEGEILPLLLGNGTYVNDYVIISMPYVVDDAFADGTPIEITLTLSLTEYISYNKLEQQKQAARKSAFAVGNKRNVILRPEAPATIIETSAQNITAVKTQGVQVDDLVTEIENTSSTSEVTADKLKVEANKGVKNLTALMENINTNPDIFTSSPGLYNSSAKLLVKYNELLAVYPFPDKAIVSSINLNLQSDTRSFSRSGTSFLQSLIVRNG